MTTQPSVKISLPFNAHVHFRDGDRLRSCVRYTAQYCGGAMAMPNTSPKLLAVDDARTYLEQVWGADMVPRAFQAFAALYLTDQTTIKMVEQAAESTFVIAFKAYPPPGATTNADAGVQDWKGRVPVLKKMAELNMPLCMHGELVVHRETGDELDIFDRERHFMETLLLQIREWVPDLRIVLEHISTIQAVEFLRNNLDVHATVTPQHMLSDRNRLLAGCATGSEPGMRTGKLDPHSYCMPILKDAEHVQEVRHFATRSFQVFWGTDSAPHAVGDKHCGCGCAGVFSDPYAPELYAEAFEMEDQLERLGQFGRGGYYFYGLTRPSGTLTLLKDGQTVVKPDFDFGDTAVVPWRAGETLPWSVTDVQRV